MGLLDSFPHKCTIRHRVRSKGTAGGSRDDFTDDQTNVLCWEQPASSAEVTLFEKRGMRVSRKVYFLTDPGVQVRNQILVTEREGVEVASPTPLDVRSEALPDATAGTQVAFKVMCDEITGEVE